MKQKITTKLANAERVADEALAIGEEMVETIRRFLDTYEQLQGAEDQFPSTRAVIKGAKDRIDNLRKELEQP